VIEFLGRRDDQAKIRGHRIELGEIESALARHPSVRETVVAAREDSPGDQRLVAYVVVQAKTEISELRRFLENKLPEVMMPSAFIFLEKLPLTPNGKVNRKALPAPQANRPGLETKYVTREPGWKTPLPGSGRNCYTWRRWGCMTISSTWVAIRCWWCRRSHFARSTKS